MDGGDYSQGAHPMYIWESFSTDVASRIVSWACLSTDRTAVPMSDVILPCRMSRIRCRFFFDSLNRWPQLGVCV